MQDFFLKAMLKIQIRFFKAMLKIQIRQQYRHCFTAYNMFTKEWFEKETDTKFETLCIRDGCNNPLADKYRLTCTECMRKCLRDGCVNQLGPKFQFSSYCDECTCQKCHFSDKRTVICGHSGETIYLPTCRSCE